MAPLRDADCEAVDAAAGPSRSSAAMVDVARIGLAATFVRLCVTDHHPHNNRTMTGHVAFAI